jgi:CubicO group peptidase (beta-lactamase class C family)
MFHADGRPMDYIALGIMAFRNLSTAILICVAAASATASSLPTTKPASQGFSPARLERLHGYMQGVIDRGEYLGAVTLVARNGKIVAFHAYGHRDLARASPMQTDAIFRIHSMTKPLTSVAVLMLMEEGKLALEDPIGKYLPELADRQVFTGGTAEAPQLRPAKRLITIHHLLTHTAGFASEGKAPDELDKLYTNADLDRAPDLATYVARLGRLPLVVDPGERFGYDGMSTEPLARLVEVVSGMAFDAFLQRRILGPLRMQDTSFVVPADRQSRVPEMTSTDSAGRLIGIPRYIKAFPSGAGGLYSTAGDYARFCQMLLDGGSLDGATILGRKTVDLMMMNHLTHLDPPVYQSGGAEGFGLGGYVVLDVAKRGRPGSAGQFGWLGAASTYFTVDREERLTAILMMQHMPQRLPRDPPKLSAPFYTLVYQALVD